MPNNEARFDAQGLAPFEHRATRMVAISFDAEASPVVTLKAIKGDPSLPTSQHRHAYGWGFAWYPDGSPSALHLKDATSVGENAMTKLLREWERFRSTVFVCHLRGAARVLQERDTHPFVRPFGGREWVFAHNGDLVGEPDQPLVQKLHIENPVHQPIGHTDSERAFCWLLERIAEQKARSIADLGWQNLHNLFSQLDELGTANLILTDGRDLAVYQDRDEYNHLHMARFVPPTHAYPT